MEKSLPKVINIYRGGMGRLFLVEIKLYKIVFLVECRPLDLVSWVWISAVTWRFALGLLLLLQYSRWWRSQRHTSLLHDELAVIYSTESWQYSLSCRLIAENQKINRRWSFMGTIAGRSGKGLVYDGNGCVSTIWFAGMISFLACLN